MYDVLDCTLHTKLRKPYFNNGFSTKLGWSSSFPYFTYENIFVHQNQNSKLQIDQSAFLHGLPQSPSMFYWLCRYLSLVINFVGILCWLLNSIIYVLKNMYHLWQLNLRPSLPCIIWFISKLYLVFLWLQLSPKEVCVCVCVWIFLSYLINLRGKWSHFPFLEKSDPRTSLYLFSFSSSRVTCKLCPCLHCHGLWHLVNFIVWAL